MFRNPFSQALSTQQAPAQQSSQQWTNPGEANYGPAPSASPMGANMADNFAGFANQFRPGGGMFGQMGQMGQMSNLGQNVQNFAGGLFGNGIGGMRQQMKDWRSQFNPGQGVPPTGTGAV